MEVLGPPLEDDAPLEMDVTPLEEGERVVGGKLMQVRGREAVRDETRTWEEARAHRCPSRRRLTQRN